MREVRAFLAISIVAVAGVALAAVAQAATVVYSGFKLPLKRNAFERLDEEGGVAKLRLVADDGYGDLFTQKVKLRFPDSGGR
jgi:hypothetical protein